MLHVMFRVVDICKLINLVCMSVCARLLSSVIINRNLIWLQRDKEGYISMATTPQACKHTTQHTHRMTEWMWGCYQRHSSMHRSYQPLKPVTNRYLQQRWDQNNYEDHRRKVGGWRWRWRTAGLTCWSRWRSIALQLVWRADEGAEGWRWTPGEAVVLHMVLDSMQRWIENAS